MLDERVSGIFNSFFVRELISFQSIFCNNPGKALLRAERVIQQRRLRVRYLCPYALVSEWVRTQQIVELRTALNSCFKCFEFRANFSQFPIDVGCLFVRATA